MEKDREFNEELLELFRNASIQADSSKKMFRSFLKLTSQRQSNGMDESRTSTWDAIRLTQVTILVNMDQYLWILLYQSSVESEAKILVHLTLKVVSD